MGNTGSEAVACAEGTPPLHRRIGASPTRSPPCAPRSNCATARNLASVTGAGVSDSQYLDPAVDLRLPRVTAPIVDATNPSAATFAIVVRDPSTFDVPITPWPTAGARLLDPGTGIEGGTVEGCFDCAWDADRLVAVNQAVGGRYVIGWSPPERTPGADAPDRVLLWHLNFHPDGGQLFWSPDGRPFIVPVAPAGDDPDLERAVGLYSDGTFGICLRPDVWHDGVYPIAGNGSFHTRQGRVHARVSCDLGAELGQLLEVPLHPPD